MSSRSVQLGLLSFTTSAVGQLWLSKVAERVIKPLNIKNYQLTQLLHMCTHF